MPELSEMIPKETLSDLERMKKSLRKMEAKDKTKSTPSVEIEGEKVNVKSPLWSWSSGSKPSKNGEKGNIIELGRTFNTKLKAEPGDILTVEIEELTVTEGGKISWAKPDVSNVDERKDKPYSLHQALSLSKRFSETLQIAKSSFKIQWVTKIKEPVKDYDPGDSNDSQLRDDNRIVSAWYSSIKRGRAIIKDGEELSLKDVKELHKKIAKELIKRQAIVFHPNNMKKYSRELFESTKRALERENVNVPVEKADVSAENEWGRSWFNVKEGDKGTFVMQEHIRGLTEEQADSFKSVTSYEDWENAKELLANKDVKASCHTDVRMNIRGKDHLIGFTPTSPPNIKEESRIINAEDEDPSLVASFKLKQPVSWQNVGKEKAEIIEPGGPGATSDTYAVFYAVDSGDVEVTYVKESGHALSFKLSDTKRVPEGVWNLNYVPVSGGRKWMFGFDKEKNND